MLSLKEIDKGHSSLPETIGNCFESINTFSNLNSFGHVLFDHEVDPVQGAL